MTSPDAATSAAADTARARSVDSFLEAKLHKPATRDEWVDRSRLFDQLDRAMTRPIALIAAPAGYGKTTLVAQWLASDRAPLATAWVSLDSGDNDPGRLWTHVAAALDRAGCVVANDFATYIEASGGELMAGVLPGLLNVLAALPDEILIVLDDFHFVTEPACHNQVGFFVENLPPQAHLLIISRADPSLRLGRLRAAGQLAEVRAQDLAFNAHETSSLLALEHIHLSSDAVAQLIERTEGWPAGLYLATLWLSGRADPEEFVRQFSGNNRFVGDYLTEEVLSRHTDELRDFIITMSILDRFSAPLCDFVAETTNSASILDYLERTNLFLVPLDGERRWFRFHHLFAAVARSELDAGNPGRVQDLHARAAEWFREHGHIDEAITHSLQSGSNGAAALLVQANWMKYVNAGRAATVFGWLGALGRPSVAADPAAGVTAAWMAALSGDEGELATNLDALQEFRDYGPLPDGTKSVESAIAMIHGLFGYAGPIEMLAGAQRGAELETDGRSAYYSIAQLNLGHAAYVMGDLDLAVLPLAKASDNENAPAIIRMLSLSAHSLVEAERGHHDRSRELAELAMGIVESQRLQAIPQSSMAYTALGLAQAAAGKITDATETLEHGLVLRRKNPSIGPWGTLHHLLASAKVAVDAGRTSQAQELVDEIKKRMDRYPDGMAAMRARLAVIQTAMRLRSASDANGEPLTPRELDVLRLLQGSLSLNDIAGELFLSHNTVKTHAKAVYRKLGAGSRAEAVRLARERLLI